MQKLEWEKLIPPALLISTALAGLWLASYFSAAEAIATVEKTGNTVRYGKYTNNPAGAINKAMILTRGHSIDTSKCAATIKPQWYMGLGEQILPEECITPKSYFTWFGRDGEINPPKNTEPWDWEKIALGLGIAGLGGGATLLYVLIENHERRKFVVSNKTQPKKLEAPVPEMRSLNDTATSVLIEAATGAALSGDSKKLAQLDAVLDDPQIFITGYDPEKNENLIEMMDESERKRMKYN